MFLIAFCLLVFPLVSVVVVLFVFFFFKQKTAYEMRISDWSSDVCSSDLGPRRRTLPDPAAPRDRKICRGQGPRHRSLDRRDAPAPAARCIGEIGRASCRERVCQYV